MLDKSETILDQVARDAVSAAKNAAQAVEVARQVQMNLVKESEKKIIDEERMGEIVGEQVLKVLSLGSDKDRALVLARVPYICQEIRDINASLQEIQKAVVYVPIMQRLVFGVVSIMLIAMASAIVALVVVK